MVTWGQNSTAFFGAPSPAPSTTFGSPAPSSAFGAPTPAPSGFGSPAPAPSGGLFGSTPSSGYGAAPSGGLFGSAPSGGLFGSTPAPSGGSLFGSTPAPSSSLFGNSGSSFFGSSPAPSMFGQQQPQQQQQQQRQQIPEQAARQAHLDASARQEEQRLKAALEKLHNAYQGTEMATDTKSASFSTILYNTASPEIRQEQWLQGVGLDGKLLPIAPPRPLQISEHDWTQAVLRNPDCETYMPIALVGSMALKARGQMQQGQTDTCSQQLDSISEAVDAVRQRFRDASARLQYLERSQARLRKRLLDTMRKVELVRCMNFPLQQDEVAAMKKLDSLQRQLNDQILPGFHRLQEQGRATASSVPPRVSVPENTELLKNIVAQHRDALVRLSETTEHDKRDLELIRKRVQVKIPQARFNS